MVKGKKAREKREQLRRFQASHSSEAAPITNATSTSVGVISTVAASSATASTAVALAITTAVSHAIATAATFAAPSTAAPATVSTSTPVRPVPLPSTSPCRHNEEMYIVSNAQLQQLIKKTQCKECGGDILLKANNQGMDCSFEIECLCEDTYTVTPRTITPAKFCFTENLALVLHTLISSQGYSGFRALAAAMKRPGLYSKEFESHVRHIFDTMDDFYNTIIKEGHASVRQHYSSLGHSDDGLTNIDISYDGSWMTRGHTSHIGTYWCRD